MDGYGGMPRSKTCRLVARSDVATVRFRAQQQDAGISLSLLFEHPMESGRRVDARGVVIPPWYLTTVNVLLDDMPFADFALGSLVTKNPVLALELGNDAQGKEIKVLWEDNRGDKGERKLKLVNL